MGWLEDELSEFLEGVWEDVAGWLVDFSELLLDPVMTLMIGTPAPRTDNWVFGDPVNAPWDVWIPQVYDMYIIPLTFGIWLLAFAYVGLLSPAITGYARKKTLKRLGISFMLMLVWIYIASVGLQFFHALSVAIAPTPAEMVDTFGSLIRSALSGIILTIIMLVVENTLLLLAAVVYAIRYVLIYVLTLGMPLLSIFWALQAGPMRRFAGLAESLMGFYPGLLIATLPSAIMFRMAYETELGFGLGGIAGLLISLMFIPTATVLTVFIIKNSHKMVGNAAVRSTEVAAPAGSYTRQRTARTARDVHRGMRGRSPATGSESAAYNVGQTVAHRAPTNTARNVGNVVSSGAKQAQSTVKNTFSKISRW